MINVLFCLLQVARFERLIDLARKVLVVIDIKRYFLANCYVASLVQQLRLNVSQTFFAVNPGTCLHVSLTIFILIELLKTVSRDVIVASLPEHPTAEIL